MYVTDVWAQERKRSADPGSVFRSFGMGDDPSAVQYASMLADEVKRLHLPLPPAGVMPRAMAVARTRALRQGQHRRVSGHPEIVVTDAGSDSRRPLAMLRSAIRYVAGTPSRGGDGDDDDGGATPATTGTTGSPPTLAPPTTVVQADSAAALARSDSPVVLRVQCPVYCDCTTGQTAPHCKHGT